MAQKNQNKSDIFSREFITLAGELEDIIEYKFKNPELLYKALTHSSFSNESRAQKKDAPCNERLEFLGDSVLSIVVSSYIFTYLASQQEGDLTKIRAFAVCEDALYQYAKEIELGKYLALGKGEEKTNGRGRKSILADATEAIIGAIYLDSDLTLDAPRPLIMKIALPRIEEICDTIRCGGHKNYKGALQQLVQNSRGDVLEYREKGESGPDHAKVFTISVMLNSNEIGVGTGRTKQEAEQAAAKVALELFGENV